MLDFDHPRETRLRRALKGVAKERRVTPVDAFKLARTKWLEGERIEIGSLAAELGIGRATLFRWVGSRELLIGEILWSFARPLWDRALKETPGEGPDYCTAVIGRMMELILAQSRFNDFVQADPEYALRVLTSKSSVVQARMVAAIAELLRSQTAAGKLSPALEIEELAYVITRIGESCMYSDRITGREPNLRIATDSIRILLSARSNAAAPRKRAAGSERRSRTVR